MRLKNQTGRGSIERLNSSNPDSGSFIVTMTLTLHKDLFLLFIDYLSDSCPKNRFYSLVQFFLAALLSWILLLVTDFLLIFLY